METKHLSAQEAFELANQKREKILLLDDIIENVKQRSENSYCIYWKPLKSE